MLHPSERRWEEQLAAPVRAGRINILAAFMSQRASLQLPNFDKENYWRTCLYYKPDSVADIEPFEWEEKPEEWYTEEQAHDMWISKGCKFIHSLDFGSSVIFQKCAMFGWLRQCSDHGRRARKDEGCKLGLR